VGARLSESDYWRAPSTHTRTHTHTHRATLPLTFSAPYSPDSSTCVLERLSSTANAAASRSFTPCASASGGNLDCSHLERPRPSPEPKCAYIHTQRYDFHNARTAFASRMGGGCGKRTAQDKHSPHTHTHADIDRTRRCARNCLTSPNTCSSSTCSCARASAVCPATASSSQMCWQAM
jgi:hypothetical protein